MVPAPAQPAISHQRVTPKLRKLPKAKPVKKRKSLFRKFAEEAFDLVEDIFD
ncbi:hypothetical protein [Sulfitobacter sp.]|uniref:hypothetical protein n=1 Tax=Sulfitobacter sp. TaxID=1903071 RepID=UPI003001B514